MKNIFEILAKATNPNSGLVKQMESNPLNKDGALYLIKANYIKSLKTKENFQSELINVINHQKPFCSRENDAYDEWYNYDLKVIALDFLINYYE